MQFNILSSRHGRTMAWVLTIASLAAPAAAMSLRQLRALETSEKQGSNYANYYLVGAMEGVLEAHAHGVRQGAKPTICPKAALEPRMAKGLFDAELKRHPGVYEADMSVPLVLANALAAVYPCQGS